MDRSIEIPINRIPKRIALVGSYIPRQCGIATFTADLADAILASDPSVTIDVIAMSDRAGYRYPARVAFEIDADDCASYRQASSFINRNEYDLLCVQHEYGIFGGRAGDYLMQLVRTANMPLVTTLHTVLEGPSPEQRSVMDELLSLSERVVVMSEKAVSILSRVHNVPEEKIDLIHHGIPKICAFAAQDFRESLKIDGPMILTFGLLSPDKGIQHAIQALPKIVEQNPGATYVVVGATHPHIRESSGEAYRKSLQKLAKDLGVEANVRFVDRYVSLDELVQYLGATDYYITPYLNENQITSGTLAYAVGAGKAVISTPYHYATDILANGRGAIVPFRDHAAIAESVNRLSNDPGAYDQMAAAAAEFGSQMLWPEVGNCYLRTFNAAKRSSADRLRQIITRMPSPLRIKNNSDCEQKPDIRVTAPLLNLQHIMRLTDDTGIIQHATYTVPNRLEGYCVDDNARALLMTVLVEEQGGLTPEIAMLQNRYLSFVDYAFNRDTGRFRNFMSYERQWLEDEGSEDSQARSLWCLGMLINRTGSAKHREFAKELFLQALPSVMETSSLRAWAYGQLGCCEVLRTAPELGVVRDSLKVMADRLMRAFVINQLPDWPWFEHRLTYANARLAQSFIESGQLLRNDDMLYTGLVGLDWLMKVQTNDDGVFVPIGSNGFYIRGNRRAMYDQQPIEAWASISACLSASRITGDSHWRDEANRAFGWFHGRNSLQLPVACPQSGGCHDGLHEDRINENQGAESTLAYCCSILELALSRSESLRSSNLR